MENWALVTGSAQRIGAGIVQELHEKGFNVIIHYRNSDSAADSICKALNKIRANSAVIIQADLSTEQGVNSLVKQIENKGINLKVLVNNASEFYPTPLESLDFTTCEQMLHTNLTAPYMLAKHLAALLSSNKGVIINLLDIHGRRPLQNFGLYSITKAALEMATLSLAQELAPNIRVNGIAPGAILWPDSSNEELQHTVAAEIPLKRSGCIQDITQTINYLVDAEYVTGQIIAVDGGRSASGYKGAE